MNQITPFQNKYSLQDLVPLQQRIADGIQHKGTWIHILGLTEQIAGALLPDLWKVVGDYCQFEHLVPTIDELEELLVKNEMKARTMSFALKMLQLSVEDYFKLPILHKTPESYINFDLQLAKTNQQKHWLVPRSRVHDHKGIYHPRMRFMENGDPMLVIHTVKKLEYDHETCYSCYTMNLIISNRNAAIVEYTPNTHNTYTRKRKAWSPSFFTCLAFEVSDKLAEKGTEVCAYKPLKASENPTPQ